MIHKSICVKTHWQVCETIQLLYKTLTNTVLRDKIFSMIDCFSQKAANFIGKENLYHEQRKSSNPGR
jgi:hypothetical protein